MRRSGTLRNHCISSVVRGLSFPNYAGFQQVISIKAWCLVETCCVLCQQCVLGRQLWAIRPTAGGTCWILTCSTGEAADAVQGRVVMEPSYRFCSLGEGISLPDCEWRGACS